MDTIYIPKPWTLEQIKLAEELCFTDRFKNLVMKHAPEDWVVHYIDFKAQNCRLMRWIMTYSRADGKRGLYPLFDNIITDLLSNVIDKTMQQPVQP